MEGQAPLICDITVDQTRAMWGCPWLHPFASANARLFSCSLIWIVPHAICMRLGWVTRQSFRCFIVQCQWRGTGASPALLPQSRCAQGDICLVPASGVVDEEASLTQHIPFGRSAMASGHQISVTLSISAVQALPVTRCLNRRQTKCK